jgi:putative flippase GtrA
MIREATAPAARPPGGWRNLVFSPRARVARFAVTGGMAGALQLALLVAITSRGWPALAANAAAFLLAAQVNFGLSGVFTWPDRRRRHSLGRRWLLFHGSIACMALVNMAVFALMRLALPDLQASAAGIAAAACGNYLVGDRLVFGARPRRAKDSAASARSLAP